MNLCRKSCSSQYFYYDCYYTTNTTIMRNRIIIAGLYACFNLAKPPPGHCRHTEFSLGTYLRLGGSPGAGGGDKALKAIICKTSHASEQRDASATGWYSCNVVMWPWAELTTGRLSCYAFMARSTDGGAELPSPFKGRGYTMRLADPSCQPKTPPCINLNDSV